MNTKKQNTVKKISNYYSKFDSKSVILCDNQGLDTYQIKSLKNQMWGVGSLMLVKNTLFKVFLKENNIDCPSNAIKNSKIAIFSDDFLKALSTTKKLIRNLKLKNLKISSAFLEKKYFDEKDINYVSKYNETQDIKRNLCRVLKETQIRFVKLLYLQVNKNK